MGEVTDFSFHESANILKEFTLLTILHDLLSPKFANLSHFLSSVYFALLYMVNVFVFLASV